MIFETSTLHCTRFFPEATIPPKSYAGRFVKHFSEHVIEVDEVLETAFHCAL